MSHDDPGRGMYAIVRRFIECLSDTGDRIGEAADLLAPGAVFVEMPNAITPRGGMRDRKAMVESMREGRRMLVRQHYDIHAHHVIDAQVVIRMTWTGVLADAVGGLAPGTPLRAHIAQFFTLDGGLITRIESYDCYEPLGEPIH